MKTSVDGVKTAVDGVKSGVDGLKVEMGVLSAAEILAVNGVGDKVDDTTAAVNGVKTAVDSIKAVIDDIAEMLGVQSGVLTAILVFLAAGMAFYMVCLAVRSIARSVIQAWL